jgi:hypothetical protein
MRELSQCGEKAEVAAIVSPTEKGKSDEHPAEGYSAPVLAGGTIR